MVLFYTKLASTKGADMTKAVGLFDNVSASDLEILKRRLVFMEWLKNNAVVVFIIIGLITYIEVRLSDLKADLKADNQELRSDIKEIRSLLITYILKNNDGSATTLALKSKKSGLKPQKSAKALPANKPTSPVAVPKSKTLSDLAQRERE